MKSLRKFLDVRLAVVLFLVAMPGCFSDSEDEIVTPLRAEVAIGQKLAQDAQLGVTCQGSIPLALFIEGGHGPYEAVFTVKNQTPSSALETPYGPLSTEETVVLKMQFSASGGGGGFGVPQPALLFVDPSLTKIAGVAFRVLVKDDDSSVSFRNAIPGQPLPPELSQGDIAPLPFQDPSVFETLISTCSQR